jgi:hypothetical protein
MFAGGFPTNPGIFTWITVVILAVLMLRMDGIGRITLGEGWACPDCGLPLMA